MRPLTFPHAYAAKSAHQPSYSLLLATAALMLLFGAGRAFAQQSPNPDPGWSQNDNDQYPADQQPDQQGYGIQPYQQQPYQQPYPNSEQVPPPQGYGQAPIQPLYAGQLEQLVAPIALYPDALVAQILAASTYPGQVADADRWRQRQGYASPDQIAAGADIQNWDPSVKALTAFPQVLAQMDRNLQWTSELSNAYYNQPQDVLQAVQVMRRRAEAAGTLRSTPQQAVQYDQGYIQVMPVNPQVVYVPEYNPWTVYGDPVSPYPGFSLLGAIGSFLGSSPLKFGLGMAMSAFSHTPWGWLAWGLNWLVQSVFFHDSNYFTHSTTVRDWGFRHEGFHAYAGRHGEFARHEYRGGPGDYHRFGGGYSGYRGHESVRPTDRYAESWRGNSNRGYQTFRGGFAQPPRQAFNHTPESRPQFDRRAYGSGSSRGPNESFGGRGGVPYERSMQGSMQAYRTPAPNFSHGGFDGRSFDGRSMGAFSSKDYARSSGKQPHSGGSHLFGGGHEKAPKAPKMASNRGFGGFHGGGGGHAPKMHGGGGHGFGGGGGHSHGGGGHSGGHGGGKHHH